MRRIVSVLSLVLLCGVIGKAQQSDIAAVLGYPQTIFYNGKIVTMNDTTFTSNVGTIAQAMAIRDDRILARGTNAEIRALAGPQTKQIDLKGRTVLPSFIMTHEHPTDWMWTEPLAFRHILPNDDVIVSRYLPNLPAKEQLALFEPTMKEAVAKAKPGQWIRITPNWGPDYEWAEQFSGPRGGVWNESMAKEYLDLLAPNNPVCVSNGFTAACMVNQKGVEEWLTVHPEGSCPVEGETCESPGMARGRLGRPTGSDVMLKGKLPVLADILNSEFALWARYGITTFGGGPYAFSNLQAMNLLSRRGDMVARFAWAYDGPAWDLQTGRMVAGALGTGSDHLWLIGARGEGGGCFSVPERANWMQEIGAAPQQGGSEERCSNAKGSFGYQKMVNIAEGGLRVAGMHSGGDRGVDNFMDAIEEGSKRAGMTTEDIRAKRHAFDHSAGAPRPQQIPRIKNLGIIVSQLNTILWETHRGASVIAKQYGVEYTNWVVPRKSLIDASVMNTFEIDRPLPHKVFFFITKGMNRYNDRDKQVYGAGERTDRIAQLKALTTWGGYYALREKTLGMLEPNSYADFLILDRDYLTIPEADIPKIQILMTVVGGRPVHLGADVAREFGMQPLGPTTWTEPILAGWEPKQY